MIKLNGKYSLGADEFLECEVTAMGGYLMLRTRTDVTQLQKYAYSPKNTNLVEIRPEFSKVGIFKPKNHNYVIEYIGEDGEEHLVFVTLTNREKRKLKINLGKHWSQRMELRVTLIASVVTLFLSPPINDMYYHIFGKKRENNHLKNNPIETPIARPNVTDSTKESNGLDSMSPKINSIGISINDISINDTLQKKESSLSQKSDTTINL